jgi:hypothetical protein
MGYADYMKDKTKRTNRGFPLGYDEKENKRCSTLSGAKLEV